MSGFYTIRESLQGKLVDFIRTAGFQCVLLEGLVRDLAVELASYREEGVPLFPEIYVFASASVQSSLVSFGEKLAIREVKIKDAASSLLKDCAPLAVDGWSIYAVKEGTENLRYGLFRSQRHSLSTNTDEAMVGLSTSSPVVLIRNRGHQTVELRTGTGEKFTAVLKATVAAPPDLDSNVESFVQTVVSGLDEAADFRAYISRLLLRLLQRCHGTLLGACVPSVRASQQALTDSVKLDPPINLYSLHTLALQQKDANSLSDLQAAEALLQGMINSDGVIVFSCDGKILGYRSFLKPSASESKLVGKDGGGRKRTFNLMKLRVPKIFAAVFFRSQDGATGCHRSDDGI